MASARRPPAKHYSDKEATEARAVKCASETGMALLMRFSSCQSEVVRLSAKRREIFPASAGGVSSETGGDHARFSVFDMPGRCAGGGWLVHIERVGTASPGLLAGVLEKRSGWHQFQRRHECDLQRRDVYDWEHDGHGHDDHVNVLCHVLQGPLLAGPQRGHPM